MTQQEDRAQIEAVMIAAEQYLTTLVLVALKMPGPNGVAALDAARSNLIDKAAALVEANK